ncbi:MAG: hypothetical protein R3D33_12650 [Hyphomicrobiaceae bacterium]
MARHIEDLAQLSVARGCSFAALAVFTFTAGFLDHPPVALKAAGMGALLICAVLLLKAANALNVPYRKTEVWIMLEERDRPVEAVAQRVIGRILKAAYLEFAMYFAVGGAMLLALGLGLAVIA